MQPLQLAAWAGGALFAASLLFFVYFYFVQLGLALEPGSGTPSVLTALVVNLVLFGLFAAHHSLMARTGAKEWVRRQLPARFERSAYVWIASLLFLELCLLWQPIEGVLWSLPWYLAWILYLVQLGGIALTVMAVQMLDPLELAGIRQVIERPKPPMPPVFKTEGAYGIVRHPIYLGWVLIVFAAPHMTMSRLMFAVVSTGYLVAAIPWEEQSLVQTAGEIYRQYQRRVPWRLIPRVW